jgi:8-oxo-dGTP pyrophosphatase MutT (NUDIX family)
MPAASSKKQYRFMMAILHGKGDKKHPRGNPPKSIASKYSKPGKGAPESKDNDRGGKWDDNKKEKHSKKLKKAFEQYYRGQGAGIIVVNEDGNILVGKDANTGEWCTPGGSVDPGEDFEEAAHRELREEANIVSTTLHEVTSFRHMGNDCKTFYTDSYSGKPSDSKELKDVQWMEPHKLATESNVRSVCKISIKQFLESQFNLRKNTIKSMVAIEELNKSIIRGGARSDVVYDVSHGEALRLVGTGCFKFLKRQVDDMGQEDFKDIHIDTHVMSIRKHLNDVYSGRVSDGHKVIHQFANKSLPQLCADIMSLFEWYSEEDEEVFESLIDENAPDDAILGGLNELTQNYTKHNLANIYTEMENIREEVRNGMAVDLQQIEEKIMKLFDKLESTTLNIADKHNKLTRDAGDEVEQLEAKLKELANKVDSLSSRPESIEAYQSKPVSPDKVYDSQYFYLPKPCIEIEPNGKIKISFNKDWTDMEKSNFLNDMKAKIVKKSK